MALKRGFLPQNTVFRAVKNVGLASNQKGKMVHFAPFCLKTDAKINAYCLKKELKLWFLALFFSRMDGFGGCVL